MRSAPNKLSDCCVIIDVSFIKYCDINPYQWAAPQEIANEAWKFATANGGTSIRVRGKQTI